MMKLMVWSKYKVLRFLFTVLGKNPYAEGTVGSLRWKRRRGKTLSKVEENIDIEWDSLTATASEWLEVLKTMEPTTHYYDAVFALLDNLPQSIKDDLYDTPLSEVDPKIRRFLPLANALRQHRSVVLANQAVRIATIAVVVSVVATGVSAILTVLN